MERWSLELVSCQNQADPEYWVLFTVAYEHFLGRRTFVGRLQDILNITVIVLWIVLDFIVLLRVIILNVLPAVHAGSHLLVLALSLILFEQQQR